MTIFKSVLLLLLFASICQESNCACSCGPSCKCGPSCSCGTATDVQGTGTLGQCGVREVQELSNKYIKVVEPTLAPIYLQDLPGYTRSVYERDYALITPESQVFSPITNWTDALGAFLITPAMGSHFSMYFARMKSGSKSAPPSKGVERLVFVVDGSVQLTQPDTPSRKIQEDGYAYLPPGSIHTVTSNGPSTLLIFERRYTEGSRGAFPLPIVGVTDEQPLLDTPGEVFALRKLLPTTDAYDFNIHIMDFQPGEHLNVKEVHYNQHGLLLLEGRGIYRLGKDWYPVQAGDVIWMAPYVPQWYAALGRTRSRYILYKDVNRDPLLH